MTNEEAIKDIEENILPIVGGKSLLMAIEALKKAPTALDHIHNVVSEREYQRGYEKAKEEYDHKLTEIRSRIKDHYYNLGYEQGKADANRPEIPDSSDAISRQDAIEAINLWLYCDKDERMPADVIKALPAVQTEIIHCKDCLYKKICSWKSQGATFCSFGERGNSDGQ